MEQQDPSQNAAGPYAREREALIPVSTLESWTVGEGEPDVRGWEVQSLGGRPLGAVGDLLVDDAAGEVVFLDIDLSANDRRTFVPARVVQFDRVRRLVLMDSADLPESDVPRAKRTGTIGRQALKRAIHYPSHPSAGAQPSAAMEAERRRAEQRRIDRVSSDF